MRGFFGKFFRYFKKRGRRPLINGESMARARNIKPGIFDNEELAALSPITRLLFIYLWMLADKSGRLEDRPARIQKQALGYDKNIDADELLTSLHDSGFILRYEAQGMRLIQIVNFQKHQTPHVREQASQLPGPEVSTAKAVPKHNLGSYEASPRSPDSLIPDSLIPDSGFTDSPITDSPNHENPQSADADLSVSPPAQAAKVKINPEVQRIFEHWKTRMNHQGAKLDDKRKAKITNALKLGYSADDLIFAIDGCAKSPHHMGRNETGTVYDSIDLIFRSADKIDFFIKKNALIAPAGVIKHAPDGRKLTPTEIMQERIRQSESLEEGQGDEPPLGGDGWPIRRAMDSSIRPE